MPSQLGTSLIAQAGVRRYSARLRYISPGGRTMLPDPPRKPIDATLPRTDVRPERRANRLVAPPCSACGRDRLRAILRTDYVVYFRCEHCSEVWSVAKPEEQMFGT